MEPDKGKTQDGFADQCVGVLSDDATAVTGNQHSGGLSAFNSDAYDTNLDGYAVLPEPTPQDAHVPAPISTTNSETAAKPPVDTAPNNLETMKSSPSSFAQLVKSWETYIADAQNTDAFQPMQMLQSIRTGMCGTGHEMHRLTLAPSTELAGYAASEGQDPFEPIILRHTHSTPLQYRPSFFTDYDGSSGMPPPSQLDATRRSSSTPSRGSAFQQFRSDSAYGAYIRSGSNFSGSDGRSAFGFPLNRSMYSGVSTESNLRTSSAFNPVPSSLSTTQEDSPQGEATAIEVMDLGTCRAEADDSANSGEESGEIEVQINTKIEDNTDQTKPKKSAAARAARFLSDVGVLRRKKKGLRSTISTVISTDTTAANKKANATTLDATRDDEKEQSKEANAMSQDSGSNSNNTSEGQKDSGYDQPSAPMYQQLDSDVDEEYDRYQSIENSGGDSDDSPRTVPSPDYHPIVDDRSVVASNCQGNKNENRRPAVRIQVSSSISVMPTLAERIDRHSENASSPNPGELVNDDPSATPTSSTGSPGGATRSSNTTYTSGHTTQATSTSGTTANGSSQISETDREVMETIKEGKRRRRQEDGKSNSDTGGVTIDSSSSGSSTTNGYVALTGSPGPLRDGANVVADRFFTNPRSTPTQGGEPFCSSSMSTSAVVDGAAGGMMHRARVSSLTRKSTNNGSPTSCSLNSIEETPPTFVSYLDRQDASDLTSLREATEASCSRGDNEEREDSPAQIVGYPAMFLGDAKTADGQENAMSVFPIVLPTTEHLYNILGRFRSRPPRSPAKGLRAVTPTPPPPRLGSPVFQHQLSPPRKIIDHRVETNVSRPYVVRTNPSTHRLVVVSPGSYVRPTTPLLCIPVGNPNYSPNQNRPQAALPLRQPSPYGQVGTARTYEEHSIEILKKDSKDEMIGQRFASPETVASAN
ncbi:expressed unknown protein [Seminavis robusta]|uniref:Uncharacterized protein n=1 Tax=Seminavis robusta TaxID=568900 RepID=A0A9N8E9R0_9STRA|nr:expressed unknown protein [Seminavis robusta]|eukprot:Sro702_g189910.1 n/a (928) ;mRNA; r:15714-18497